MLTVLTGSMYSGKSSLLISKAISHVIAGDFVIAFKPQIDNRYDLNNIVTHHSDKFPAYVVSGPEVQKQCNEIVYKLLKIGNKIDVILFDEVQFFDESIICAVEDYMNWCHVIVAGLANDSFGKPFGQMPSLLCMADDIVNLKAVCSKCKSIGAATRTFRKCTSTEQIVVGGADAFEARCFKCWLGG